MDKEIKRVNFHKQQLLTADEFVTEQEYHTTMRRVQSSACYEWGVVDGLTVEVVP